MADKKAKKTGDESAPAANFEKELAKLEGIVEKLEGDMPGLDEAIKLYETGVKSLKACQKTLDQAEARIRMLTEGRDGPELKPFDADAEAEAEAERATEEAGEDQAKETSAPRKRRAARKPRGRGLF